MWMSNFINFESRHQNIMESFEDRYNEIRSDEENKIDSSAEPVNILCIDGGGLKGYCAISIFEALQEQYCKEGQDFFSQFDLVAGTSVGGIYSYFISLYNGKGCNTQGVVLHGRDMMDHVTENSLRKLSPMNLLCCDDMIQEGTLFKAPVSFLILLSMEVSCYITNTSR